MAAPSYPLPLRAVDALRRGDTVEAIKILRAETALDLKSAKNIVDAFRRGEMVTVSRLPPAHTESRSAAEARHVVAQTGVAEGMREASGFGLAQAQDALATSRFRDHPTGVGGRSPGETPRTGPLLRWIAIIALAGYALYSFLLRSVHFGG
jgi:hypothetical protein